LGPLRIAPLFVLGWLLLPTSTAWSQGTQVPLGDLEIEGQRIPDIAAEDEIPVDTTGWTVVPYVGEATGSAVNAAVNSLPDQSVLLLPDGTYSGHLQVRRSHVVVRGNCETPGAVRWRNDGNPFNQLFSGPLCNGGSNHGNLCWNGDVDCPGGFCDGSVSGTLCTASWLQLCGADNGDHLTTLLSPPYVWSGPFTYGSTTLSVADSAGASVGDKVWITSDPLPGPGELADTDDFNWMAEVVAVGGNEITIDQALPIDFNPGGPNGPRVRRFDKLLEDAGVECLTFDHLHPDDVSGFYTNLVFTARYAWNSWFSRIDFGDTYNTHGRIERSARLVLTGNSFGEQWKSAPGGSVPCTGPPSTNPCFNKQALVFDEAHANSFIDNTVSASIGVELAHSSSNNWIAYNWFPRPALHPDAEPRRAVFPHGNYGYANVIEGNVFWGVGEMDEVWLSQGPRYVWFRNLALGNRSWFTVEAWAGAPDPFVVSRDASYLLNQGRLFGYPWGAAIDIRSSGMHLERNVYTEALYAHDPTSIMTTLVENYDASSVPLGPAWDALTFPNSLNREVVDVPAFWPSSTLPSDSRVCGFEVHGGIGALWDGECLLPAQSRDPRLFISGFESGDTTDWTSATP
jgi:hypothetical protein